MLLLEVVRVSLDSLRANKLRSLLTMLGIVIGVAAVIAMTALGNGASRAVQDRITALGTRLLQVDAARQLSGGIAVQNPVRMTERDVTYLRENNTMLAEIEPQQDRNVQITYRNQNTNTQVTGATSNFLEVRSYEMDVGRMFTDHEDKARRLYAVLGADVIGNLNMPSAESVIGDHIQQLLRRSHKIGAGKPDDFRIRSSQEFLNTLSETTQTFTLLLAGIASVSLLVGGIGIMNIMLVSVTERTREIGIRKALGATRINILVQFLIEAVVLCIAGGLLGAAIGMGSAVGMRSAFGWNTVVGPDSILMAVAFSGTVGVLFGAWPARRAATLDPIEALRFE